MKNTKNKHYVLVDKESREVIACISDNGKDDIVRKDVDLKVYEGTEPVFTETNHGILLKDNAFTMRLQVVAYEHIHTSKGVFYEFI